MAAVRMLHKQGADTTWNITSYALHNEAIRAIEDRFMTERDRRYTEVNV